MQLAEWPIFRVMSQAQADRLRHDAECERRRAERSINVRERKVPVGRITLHEASERVRAKEQAASAKATDAIG